MLVVVVVAVDVTSFDLGNRCEAGGCWYGCRSVSDSVCFRSEDTIGVGLRHNGPNGGCV